MAYENSLLLRDWKRKMKKVLRRRFGDKLSKDEIYSILDKVIEENIYNPEVVAINNYRNKQFNSDILAIYDFIQDNNLVMGGAGTLFLQPSEENENILAGFIMDKMGLRNFYKGERKHFEKNSDPWIRFDILQTNTKILINSLYGAIGYMMFVLFNRYIAEAVTNCGRQIISTAVMTFENFLSDSIQFNEDTEFFNYITNILSEYNEEMDFTIFDEITDEMLIERLVKKCAFTPSTSFIRHLKEIVKGTNHGERVLLYYKNNLFEFSRLPFIKDKLKKILLDLPELKNPSIKSIDDSKIVELTESVWEFYDTFVLYKYPIADKIRKTMYTDRRSVIYIDTDSNFLALNKWYTFVMDEILEWNSNKSEIETTFEIIMLMAIFLERVINNGLFTMCKYMNVNDEYANMLKMKNEFYMSRILFTEAKKRYVSNALLQEGDLLKGGEGLPEIKGFDFKKAGTKPFVREFFTDVCLNEILRTKDINVARIYKKMIELRKDIESSMKKGESKYYKQTTVQIVEHYKIPYSNQGITSVTIWNTLNPEMSLDLPTDVDIVPIRDLTWKNKTDANKTKLVEKMKMPPNVVLLQEKYPDLYDKLAKEIWFNPNMVIANMSMKYIAKPKNANVELPEWFGFLVDTSKVVNDTLSLGYSICRSLGIKTLKASGGKEHLSNVIDIW